ncbi:MAG: aminotransferase class V-fold PLP-dependent enzyme [Thermoanaerobaculia bacterium]
MLSDPYFAELRRREFGRLDERHLAYLDYTGSALYGESQIRAHHALLQSGVFGNPHAENAPSRASTEAMEAARSKVLEFLDVDLSTHDICFTANATAAIKLVGESYPFHADSTFLLAVDNHNSVNGIREYARRAGARVHYVPLDAELRLDGADAALAEAGGRRGGLFAYPAQSNFSGVQHPLSLVERARNAGFDVLLDLAAFAPSNAVSLRTCPADFAALSFYKLFGYPTGIGALVVRREAFTKLRRPWFSGGTVMYASVLADTHRLRHGHEAFEDGTPDFLNIVALGAGFALLDEVRMSRLSAHVRRLTANFLDGLGSLRHGNGVPLAQIYGPAGTKDRGGTVAFNVCDRNGEPIPHSAVEERARMAGVSLRVGCFCNPGASEVALGLGAERLAECLDSIGEGFTIDGLTSCMGTAVGAVRVSVGLANNDQDILRAIDVVRSFEDH